MKQCQSCYLKDQEGGAPTFHLLSSIEANMPSNIDGVADEGVPTRMMDRTLKRRVELDHIHCEPCTLCERAEFVIDRLCLNCVEWNERRLTSSLVSHVLSQLASQTGIEGHCQ